MHDEDDTLAARIAALNDSQAAAACAALTRRLRQRAAAANADDTAALTAIDETMTPGAAEALLQGALPEIAVPGDPRAMLAALAADPDFAADVTDAVDRAQFVVFTGVELMLIAAAVTFVLQIKFNWKVAYKDGKLSIESTGGKAATEFKDIKDVLAVGAGGLPKPDAG